MHSTIQLLLLPSPVHEARVAAFTVNAEVAAGFRSRAGGGVVGGGGGQLIFWLLPALACGGVAGALLAGGGEARRAAGGELGGRGTEARRTGCSGESGELTHIDLEVDRTDGEGGVLDLDRLLEPESSAS